MFQVVTRDSKKVSRTGHDGARERRLRQVVREALTEKVTPEQTAEGREARAVEMPEGRTPRQRGEHVQMPWGGACSAGQRSSRRPEWAQQEEEGEGPSTSVGHAREEPAYLAGSERRTDAG